MKNQCIIGKKPITTNKKEVINMEEKKQREGYTDAEIELMVEFEQDYREPNGPDDDEWMAEWEKHLEKSRNNGVLKYWVPATYPELE